VYQEKAARRDMSAALFFEKNSNKTDISNSYIGLQFFFCHIIKKKKIKNQIMNGGIKSPPIH
jgi:hypothetical protein